MKNERRSKTQLPQDRSRLWLRALLATASAILFLGILCYCGERLHKYRQALSLGGRISSPTGQEYLRLKPVSLLLKEIGTQESEGMIDYTLPFGRFQIPEPYLNLQQPDPESGNCYDYTSDSKYSFDLFAPQTVAEIVQPPGSFDGQRSRLCDAMNTRDQSWQEILWSSRRDLRRHLSLVRWKVALCTYSGTLRIFAIGEGNEARYILASPRSMRVLVPAGGPGGVAEFWVRSRKGGPPMDHDPNNTGRAEALIRSFARTFVPSVETETVVE